MGGTREAGGYVEIFAGGQAFFAKDPPEAEASNDLDRDLVTLYRSIKHHQEELYKQFKFSLVARSEFEREQMVNLETLADIQRWLTLCTCGRMPSAVYLLPVRTLETAPLATSQG